MSNLSQVLTPGGDALVDSYLTILRGDIRPSRTVVVEGKSVDVPEGCRFRFILPPDKKALRYQQLGRPRIDKKNNYCEAAFLVGVPVAYAGDPKYGTKTTLMNQGYQSSAGYFKMWWQDPPGLQVTWAQASIWWGWQGPLFCATYEGGAWNDWGWSTTGWYKVDQWNVGNTTSCNLVGYTGSSLWKNIGFPPCWQS
jgi:hypothetical protein